MTKFISSRSLTSSSSSAIDCLSSFEVEKINSVDVPKSSG